MSPLTNVPRAFARFAAKINEIIAFLAPFENLKGHGLSVHKSTRDMVLKVSPDLGGTAPNSPSVTPSAAGLGFRILFQAHFITWATPDEPTLTEVTTYANDAYTDQLLTPIVGDHLFYNAASPGHAAIFIVITSGPTAGAGGNGTVTVGGYNWDFCPSYAVNS